MISTSNYVRPTLAEIKNRLDRSIKAALGDDVNVGPDSLLGQLNGIYAALLDEAHANIEYGFSQLYPATASDIHLDKLGELVGVYRQRAGRLKTVLAAYSSTADARAAVGGVINIDGKKADVVEVQTPSSNIGVLAYLKIENRQSANVRLETLQGQSISFNLSGAGDVDTAKGILSGGGYGVLTDEAGYLGVHLNGETFKAASTDMILYSGVTVASDARITAGAIARVGTMTYKAWFPSRGQISDESDADFRQRVYAKRTAVGLATVETMQTYITSNVPGVTSCSVTENVTDDVVQGQPPRTVHVAVSGTFSADTLARAIRFCRPAGIPSFGSTGVAGERWSTLGSLNSVVSITVTEWMPETAVSARPAASDIETYVRGMFSSHANGEDVSPFRVASQIATHFPAIARVDVQINGSTGVVRIAPTVKFTPSRVTVAINV